MSGLLKRITELVEAGDVSISQHATVRMAARGLEPIEVIAGIDSAMLIEEYPDFHTGPAVLVLQSIDSGGPVHVVWGIPLEGGRPARIVTAYRPDPAKWSDDFRRRK